MTGWRDVYRDLVTRLDRGDWSPGDTLPRQADLAAALGVSRPTVARAMSELIAEGRLRTVRWWGTVVADPAPLRLAAERYRAVTDPARDRPDLGPWETACAQRGITGYAELTGVETVAAGADVAERLAITEGEHVTRRTRVMWADQQRLQLQRAHYPAAVVERVPALRAGERITGGVYGAMAAAGVAPTTAREEVSGRIATSAEGDQLDVGARAPVLTVWRTTYAEGTPVEVVHTIAAAGAVALTYEDLPLTPPVTGPGTEPEPATVAAAVVTSGRGVLVAQRHDRSPPWTLPAGEIEPGESASQAAAREVMEETGLPVRITGEVGRRVHPRTGRTMVYLAAVPSSPDRTDVYVGDADELAAVRWASLSEAEQLLPGLYEPVRAHLARTLGE